MNPKHQPSSKERDPYIDFLRGFGLLLLIVAHTHAPEFLNVSRTFDVPLMIVISAICYRPLRVEYLSYFTKRFKRIYFPVVTFLTIFFAISLVIQCVVGRPTWKIPSIIGSYLMLNQPSIGYVWIMRVFLLMALLMPLLDHVLRKSGFAIYVVTIFGLIVLQTPLVIAIEKIPEQYLRFVTDEVLLYAFGYSSLAVLGLRLSKLSKLQTIIILSFSGISILTLMGMNDWNFNPQAYKYPPQSLYLLYGIFASTALWLLKPVLKKATDNYFFQYLSRESMWVYLWHIIPVYILTPWMYIPGLWFGRYIIVLTTAILLNILWHHVINCFPEKIAKALR